MKRIARIAWAAAGRREVIMKRLSACIFGIALGAVAVPASAAIVDLSLSGVFSTGPAIGQTFTGRLIYDTDTPITGSVFGGSAFENAGSTFYIDVGSRHYNLAPVHGFATTSIGGDRAAFADPAQVLGIIIFYGPGGVLLGSASRLPTFDELALLNTKHEIFLNDGSGTFEYTRTNAAAVPEPAAWAMMVVGFGAIGFAMRGRQRQSVHCSFA